ncbi:hypothetical protein ALC57_15154, partial [Trachymyrmex cornetzi]
VLSQPDTITCDTFNIEVSGHAARQKYISRVTSRHLQINGPVDGNRLILHHLPLERTVARSTWPAAALNLARRHRHFQPFKWKPPGCFLVIRSYKLF